MYRQNRQDDSIFDAYGYRFNVGIVLVNQQNQVFFARRIAAHNAWQLPQGGMRAGEDSEQSAKRELFEETGISADAIEILAVSRDFYSYRLPSRYRRRKNFGIQCIGQRQLWYLIRYKAASDREIAVDKVAHPEFDAWEWVDYWQPLDRVVHFKYEVYRGVLQEFAEVLGIVEPAPAMRIFPQKK
ncbi:MAG: RNA pyrophosphohydrolase [Cardiobacteriaceae bacterium]|nr:RNA pyrophosphohydrolase [Cardiobacteriaceae bacterium]